MYWSQLFWGWHLQLVFSEGNVVQNTTACAESGTWFRSSDADESVWAGVDTIHKRAINGSRRWSGPWHCGFFSSHGWKSAPDATAPRNRFVSTLNLIFLGVHWLKWWLQSPFKFICFWWGSNKEDAAELFAVVAVEWIVVWWNRTLGNPFTVAVWNSRQQCLDLWIERHCHAYSNL